MSKALQGKAGKPNVQLGLLAASYSTRRWTLSRALRGECARQDYQPHRTTNSLDPQDGRAGCFSVGISSELKVLKVLKDAVRAEKCCGRPQAPQVAALPFSNAHVKLETVRLLASLALPLRLAPRALRLAIPAPPSGDAGAPLTPQSKLGRKLPPE